MSRPRPRGWVWRGVRRSADGRRRPAGRRVHLRSITIRAEAHEAIRIAAVGAGVPMSDVGEALILSGLREAARAARRAAC